MKKPLLLSLLLTSNLNATELKTNCTENELNRDKEHFCLIKDDNNYYVKEVLNIHKDDDNYSQHQRIQEIKTIQEELFAGNVKIENQNGLLIITTEQGNLYTSRVGYIQKNGHYLEIENNKIESLNIEKIKNPLKVVSQYNLYVLDKENVLWKKENDNWSKIDINNIYDYVYTKEGVIYIIAKSGIYYGMDTNEIDQLNKVNISIQEKLYKESIEKEKYENYVKASVFNSNSKLKERRNQFGELEVVLVNNNLEEKDFDISISEDELLIYKKGFRFGFDVEGIEYRDTALPESLKYYYYNDKIDEKLEIKYSLKYNTELAVVENNIIETKYNGNVLFKNKEKEILNQSNLANPVSKIEIQSPIVMSLQENKYYFVLRDNGMLTITDIENKQSKEIFNVNRIKRSVGVEILVDKEFESQFLGNFKNYKLNNISDIEEEDIAFKFKFKDLESLENKNLKKHISI